MSMMQTLLKLWPFIWPHRKLLITSSLFAILIALFWGANLSVVFPIAKVFLDGKSLPGYVQEEIASAELQVAKMKYRVEQAQQKLEALDPKKFDETSFRREQISLLEDQSKNQSLLSTASSKLTMYQWLNATVIPWAPEDPFNCFSLILCILLLATVLKGACEYAQDVLIGSMVELVAMDIRKGCFRKALKLDYQTLSKEGTSGLMSRFTYDINILATGLSLLGGKVIREPFKAVTCIVCAFLVNWQLTTLILVFVPITGLIFYRFGKLLKRASQRMMESMTRIYKTLEESFSALKVVIAFGNGRAHRRRFHLENKEFYRKAMRIVRIDALTGPVTEAMGMCAFFVALMPCSYLLLRGTTSIGGIKLAETAPDVATLGLFFAFLAGAIDPIRKLSSVYSKLKRSTAAADRVLAFMETETLVKQDEQPLTLAKLSKTIEFQNISFSYYTKENERRNEVLSDVSLTIDHGEVVVVVGENGSGKSTLINLLPRYYDPSRGSVLFDGVDIQQARLTDLRSQIGVVTQETLLFDDTIYENIRYGFPGATKTQIEDVALRAGVMQFIDNLPDGFDTVVGEKGSALSGGQRQRIALARAMLRDPAILILDEATSAIDAQSETLILQGLRRFAAGRTVFIVTHLMSPSILDFVTKVLIMDRGKLVAYGPHADVLRTCPVYQNLFHARLAKHAA